MGIIRSYISPAELAQFVSFRVREMEARGREVGEETNRTRFGGLPSGREVFVVVISDLYKEE